MCLWHISPKLPFNAIPWTRDLVRWKLGNYTRGWGGISNWIRVRQIFIPIVLCQLLVIHNDVKPESIWPSERKALSERRTAKVLHEDEKSSWRILISPLSQKCSGVNHFIVLRLSFVLGEFLTVLMAESIPRKFESSKDWKMEMVIRYQLYIMNSIPNYPNSICH